MADSYHTVSGAPGPGPRRAAYPNNESGCIQSPMYDTEKQSEIRNHYLNMPPPVPHTVRFQQPTDAAGSDSRPIISTGKSRAGLGSEQLIPDYVFEPQPPSRGLYSPYDHSIYNSHPYLPVDPVYTPYYWPPVPPIPGPAVVETQQHVPNPATSYHNTDEDHDIASNAPQNEESAVHHVIKINSPKSSYNNNEITNLKDRKRVFTDQLAFAYDSEIEKVQYDIVQTQLRTVSDDLDHEIALLTYEDKSNKDDTPRQKPETRWTYVYHLTKPYWIIAHKLTHQSVISKPIQ